MIELRDLVSERSLMTLFWYPFWPFGLEEATKR